MSVAICTHEYIAGEYDVFYCIFHVFVFFGISRINTDFEQNSTCNLIYCSTDGFYDVWLEVAVLSGGLKYDPTKWPGTKSKARLWFKRFFLHYQGSEHNKKNKIKNVDVKKNATCACHFIW